MAIFSKLKKLMRLLSRQEYRKGLRHKVAAAIEHESIIHALPIGTLIDVGANVGQFSLLTRTLHPSALIYAFEPLATPADRFESVFRGDNSTRLYRYAAAETAGSATINISARTDSSSLLPISNLQNQIFPGTTQLTTAEIQTCRIDDALNNVAIVDPLLIKLDVQGFELAALKGMPNMLDRASMVYLEVSFKELYTGQPSAHDVVAWLSSHGFRLAGANNLVSADDGTSVQADFLFHRAASAAA